MREEYKGVCRKINQLQDRFSQIKKHEIALMGELSYQLFDAKIYKHQVRAFSTRLEVFEQIEFVPQVAHDRDTYATSNISP